jgi:hypothetical protein
MTWCARAVALLSLAPLACGEHGTGPDSASAVVSLAIVAPVAARQGDVVSLAAIVTYRDGGEDTLFSGVGWRLQGSGALQEDGRFVPYGGNVRITATLGPASDTVTIAVHLRALSGSFTTPGLGPVTNRTTSDLWVWQGADDRDYAITGTICKHACLDSDERVYVWDVTDPGSIALTDSISMDARRVNDVMVSADGRFGAATHEASLSPGNGITLFDLTVPAHPTVILHHTEGRFEHGVHNLWIERIQERDYVFASANASGFQDLTILDVTDAVDGTSPPLEVAHYRGDSIEEGVHDTFVRDGLAFVAHWNHGLVILDVGNGIRGGSPSNPVEVSRIDLGNFVHHAWYWPAAGYAFVGQEASLLGMRVVDVSDLASPVAVAEFILPGESPHFFWLDEERGILFASWYTYGVRAIDVTGELLGDLTRQGREYTSIAPAGPGGPGSIWSVHQHGGVVFASDMHNGLWALQFSGGEGNRRTTFEWSPQNR